MFPYVIQTKKFANYWLILIITIILTTLFILLKKYDDSKVYMGIKETNTTKLLVEEENIASLPKQIVYENKKYDYEIKEISDEYYLDNNIHYRLITIISNYEADNKAVNIKFIYGRTSLLDKIIKIIKGGNIWLK